QPAPLVERFLTSLCGEWWPEPSRPQALCALADECRAPRNAVATATGEGVCFGWSCPRATRARSRRYVLRPPCLWHVLQSRLRSASLDRDAAGERWSIIHFRIMGSPNIYLYMCLYVSQSNAYVINFITFHPDMCLATAKSGLTSHYRQHTPHLL